MPSLDDEDLNEAFDDLDFDYTVDEDVLLQALIDAFGKTGKSNFADVLRVVKRAHRISTSDLVGSDNMVGARVTYVDGDGEPHRAIVLEPEVSGMNADEAYDPNRDEFVDPSDYPMGTCQLVHGDGWEFGTDDGFFDRLESDRDGRGLSIATSVTPARKPDTTYCYYAGWDYVDDAKGLSE